MFIAGDASGDILGAELITALRQRLGEGATFFGAGGPAMEGAGLELLDDFTRNGVFGFDAVLKLLEFRRRFQRLLAVAKERRPEVLVCVDFAGFNRRFAHAVKEHVRRERGAWQPKVIQYVSPQVWASRPGRADKMAKDVDLLLTIFPFEKAWYAQRLPQMRVEFVGHPIVERYGERPSAPRPFNAAAPTILLLPGSRPGELRQHLPVLRETLERIRAVIPATRAEMVLPDRLQALAREIGLPEGVRMQSALAEALREADLALAKSGTITLECAYFGVPSVVLYRASAITHAIARCIMSVRWIAMPNILAGEEVFPEFLQHEANAANLSRAALELMQDAGRRTTVQEKLRGIAASLGEKGASGRAAEMIIRLVDHK